MSGLLRILHQSMRDVLREVRIKFLYGEAEKAIQLMKEMMLHSDFSDEARMHELIASQRSRLEMRMSNTENVLATGRNGMFSCRRLLQIASVVLRIISLSKIWMSIMMRKRKKSVRSANSWFVRCLHHHLLVSTTGDDTAYAQVEKYLPGIAKDLFETTQEAPKKEIKLIRKKEGFKDASQVQYVCRAGNFMKDGYTFHGAMNILKVALSYDYFWINIRVKGGAYGCRGVFSLNGDTYFVSYRDPNLEKKMMFLHISADYIRAFDADERDMTKYIIGTISEMDTPLTPAQSVV